MYEQTYCSTTREDLHSPHSVLGLKSNPSLLHFTLNILI